MCAPCSKLSSLNASAFIMRVYPCLMNTIGGGVDDAVRKTSKATKRSIDRTLLDGNSRVTFETRFVTIRRRASNLNKIIEYDQ